MEADALKQLKPSLYVSAQVPAARRPLTRKGDPQPKADLTASAELARPKQVSRLSAAPAAYVHPWRLAAQVGSVGISGTGPSADFTT